MEPVENRSFKYRNWLCKWNATAGVYYLYTPGELEQPTGCRYPEMECATKDMCREFINSYK